MKPNQPESPKVKSKQINFNQSAEWCHLLSSIREDIPPYTIRTCPCTSSSDRIDWNCSLNIIRGPKRCGMDSSRGLGCRGTDSTRTAVMASRTATSSSACIWRGGSWTRTARFYSRAAETFVWGWEKQLVTGNCRWASLKGLPVRHPV